MKDVLTFISHSRNCLENIKLLLLYTIETVNLWDYRVYMMEFPGSPTSIISYHMNCIKI